MSLPYYYTPYMAYKSSLMTNLQLCLFWSLLELLMNKLQ
jgi:hypothetical protein